MSEYQATVTQLLNSWSQGNASALDQIIPLLLRDLRQTAARVMRGEKSNLALQPTALVNELWLRLATGNHDIDFQNRAQFFALCSYLMRQTLTDYARRRNSDKRGGHAIVVSLDKCNLGRSDEITELVALDQALHKLSQQDPRKARVFDLRFWAGLEIAEIAQQLSVSDASVARDWKFIKAFLRKELFPEFKTNPFNALKAS